MTSAGGAGGSGVHPEPVMTLVMAEEMTQNAAKIQVGQRPGTARHGQARSGQAWSGPLVLISAGAAARAVEMTSAADGVALHAAGIGGAVQQAAAAGHGADPAQ